MNEDTVLRSDDVVARVLGANLGMASLRIAAIPAIVSIVAGTLFWILF